MILILMSICKVIIGVLLWFSVLTKQSRELIEVATEPSPTLRKVLALIEAVHIPFVVITIFLVQVGHVFWGLFFLASLISIGFALKKLTGAKHCNCYGSLAESPGRTEYLLNAILISAALMVLFLRLRFGQQVDQESASVWLFSSGVALAALASYLLPRARSQTQISNANAASAPSNQESTFEGGDIVGYDASGEVIRVGEIASTCPMIVFIALSTGCPLCSSLKPILFPITSLFADKLRCVFLMDKQGTIDNEDNLIVRAEPAFVRKLGGEQFPFAVTVESRSLSVVGSVAYGDGIGSFITRALLIALRPSRPKVLSVS